MTSHVNDGRWTLYISQSSVDSALILYLAQMMSPRTRGAVSAVLGDLEGPSSVTGLASSAAHNSPLPDASRRPDASAADAQQRRLRLDASPAATAAPLAFAVDVDGTTPDDVRREIQS